MKKLSSKKDLEKLHDFMQVNILLHNLRHNQALINAFSQSIDAISEDIIENKTISFIVNKIQLSKNDFKINVLKKVLEHNLSLISSSAHSADCPVVKEIINTYYEIGLMVQDIFLLCDAVVRSVVSHLREVDENIEIGDLIQLFTYNIYNVFTMYSDIIERQEHIIVEKNSIIADNILFTKTDLKGIITEVTDAYCEFVGYSRDELIGKTHSMLKDPEMDSSVYKELWKTIATGHEWLGELKNIRKDGSKFVTDSRIAPLKKDGKIIGYVAFRNDITSYKLSSIDSLTSLLNRRSFEDKFDEFCNSTNNLQLNMAILDIDDFKLVNDDYGHNVGDDVLVGLSKILCECTRSTDICARWGGEEFVLLIPHLTLQEAEKILQRIIKSVAKENFIPDKIITVSAGLGQKKENEEKRDFFDRVDRKLYKAKKRGKNQVCVD